MRASSGKTETAEFLIEKGANVNAADNFGETALMKAALWGYTETAELLNAKGADVNTDDNNGENALMWASLGRYSETVELLIAKGADVNSVDNGGETALDKVKDFFKNHTNQLTQSPDDADFHSEQLGKFGKIIGILVANGAKCKATC